MINIQNLTYHQILAMLGDNVVIEMRGDELRLKGIVRI